MDFSDHLNLYPSETYHPIGNTWQVLSADQSAESTPPGCKGSNRSIETVRQCSSVPGRFHPFPVPFLQVSPMQGKKHVFQVAEPVPDRFPSVQLKSRKIKNDQEECKVFHVSLANVYDVGNILQKIIKFPASIIQKYKSLTYQPADMEYNIFLGVGMKLPDDRFRKFFCLPECF